MHTLRSASVLRASLALPFALALTACPFPKDIGDSPLDSDTDATTSQGDATTTTGPSLTTSETGDATETTTTAAEGTTVPETTTLPETVTGNPTATDTSSTDTSTTDTSTTAPPNPDGMCFDENHGDYWCECDPNDTKACRDNGVQVCLTVSFVIEEHKFSPCGVCGPGDELPCDVRGEPGRQFCNLDTQDLLIEDFDMPPTAAWGVCVLEADVVCEPGDIEKCDGGFTECLVDDQGIPFVGPCF